MSSKSKKKSVPKKTVSAKAAQTSDSAAFDAVIASMRAATLSPAGRRKELLAQVAGSVAAGLVTAPSPSISKPESMATVAVDIAEEILLKAGISPSGSSEETSSPPVEETVGAAS